MTTSRPNLTSIAAIALALALSYAGFAADMSGVTLAGGLLLGLVVGVNLPSYVAAKTGVAA